MSDILFSNLQATHGVAADVAVLDKKIADSIHASLFTAQRGAVEDRSRMKAVVCPRRAGKSWTALSYTHEVALRNPGSVSVIICLTLKSAKSIYWNSVLPRFHRTYGIKALLHHTDMRITLMNGSVIFFIGAETRAEIEKLRGASYDLVVIDECASYPPDHLREMIYDVVRPACMDRRGTVMMIGTPGSILDGPFYEGTCPNALDEKQIPYSRTFSDPEKFWTDNPRNTSWRWSRHSWTAQDNEALPHLWQEALLIKESEGWGSDHPTWLREYLGKWVSSEDVFVYAYTALKRKNPSSVSWNPDPHAKNHGLPDGNDWRFVMGLDLGFEDDFAMVVGAYSLTTNEMYHVYDYKVNHQDVYQVADHISRVTERFNHKFDAIVADCSGLGKMVIESLNRRHGWHIKAAEKREKNDHIEMVNADFHSGKIKILEDSDLETELCMLQWDLSKAAKAELAKKGRLKEHPSLPNHLCDAFLYLHRYSLHHYGEPMGPQIQAGSPQWWRQREEESIQKLMDRRTAGNYNDILRDSVQTSIDPLSEFYR